VTYTIAAPVYSTLEICKSRFVGFVLPAADRTCAMEQVQALHAQHPGATHVCWALLAGGQSGMSDDGEPSGTAGRPMLEVLRHHDLDGVLAAVVRYYGGVKLGAGGLVRAYTDAIAEALKDAQRIERVAKAELLVIVDYADEARVRRWIGQQEGRLIDYLHEQRVQMRVELALREREAAWAALSELTQGRAMLGGDGLVGFN
jgi:uncharacterized YigZ family protein